MRVIICLTDGAVHGIVSFKQGIPPHVAADCEPEEVVEQVFLDDAHVQRAVDILRTISAVSGDFELDLDAIMTSVVRVACQQSVLDRVNGKIMTIK